MVVNEFTQHTYLLLLDGKPKNKDLDKESEMSILRDLAKIDIHNLAIVIC